MKYVEFIFKLVISYILFLAAVKWYGHGSDYKIAFFFLVATMWAILANRVAQEK